MNEDLHDQIESLRKEMIRLRGLCLLQTADIFALSALLAETHVQTFPHRDATNDFGATYLRLRRAEAYRQLTTIEDTDPALAAEVKEHLDKSCRNYPLGD